MSTSRERDLREASGEDLSGGRSPTSPRRSPTPPAETYLAPPRSPVTLCPTHHGDPDPAGRGLLLRSLSPRPDLGCSRAEDSQSVADFFLPAGCRKAVKDYSTVMSSSPSNPLLQRRCKTTSSSSVLQFTECRAAGREGRRRHRLPWYVPVPPCVVANEKIESLLAVWNLGLHLFLGPY